MPFAVCISDADRCGLSSRSHALELFHELMRVAHARGNEGRPPLEGHAARLQPFARFFQANDFCCHCEQPLQRVILLTNNMDPAGEEFARTSRANALLQVVPELQLLGVLPFEVPREEEQGGAGQ
jgi:hypothetical protein